MRVVTSKEIGATYAQRGNPVVHWVRFFWPRQQEAAAEAIQNDYIEAVRTNENPVYLPLCEALVGFLLRGSLGGDPDPDRCGTDPQAVTCLQCLVALR
jgi:hypothetical protein